MIAQREGEAYSSACCWKGVPADSQDEMIP